MPTVTPETEIFDRLYDSLKIAAEECKVLAWDPRRGFRYLRFRENLSLAIGCCRQLYYWRDYDSRYLPLVRLLSFAHKRAGDWLRNSPTPHMRKLAQPQFKHLSEALANIVRDVDQLRHMATGKIGPIMPEVLPLHRDSGERQVQLILPPGFKDKRAA